MAHAYDMKRLHMGCGESLQSQRSQMIYNRLQRLALLLGPPSQIGDASQGGKKQIREKRH